jgi:hypothetical protein
MTPRRLLEHWREAERATASVLALDARDAFHRRQDDIRRRERPEDRDG